MIQSTPKTKADCSACDGSGYVQRNASGVDSRRDALSYVVRCPNECRDFVAEWDA